MIGGEEQLNLFQLHVCVKDYCFAREDRLVGVAVMQLKNIVDQVIIHIYSFTNLKKIVMYISLNPFWFMIKIIYLKISGFMCLLVISRK